MMPRKKKVYIITKPATATTPAITAPAVTCLCAATAPEEVVDLAAGAVEEVDEAACPVPEAVATTTEVIGATLEAGAEEEGLTMIEELDCLMGALEEEGV
jgi:hypothetical protein